MTAKKEPLTEEGRAAAARREKELMEKLLAAHPGIIPPTREMGEVVFDPIKIRGEPLSQTIIKMRRC